MKHFSAYIFALLLLSACSVGKYIPEGEHLLKEVHVTYDDSSKMLKEYDLKAYNQQQPNTKWFGLKVPLKIYTLSGLDTTRWTCRVFRKLGEDPVIFDSLKARSSAERMYQAIANAGYIKGKVTPILHIDGKKLSLEYTVKAGQRYHVRHISRDIPDPDIDSILQQTDPDESLLGEGMPLDINQLNQERNRIASKLRDMGYYKFTKEDIRFTIDTLRDQTDVNLTMHIKLHLENGRSTPEFHRQYHIGNITYLPESDGRYHFRRSFYSSNTLIVPGELYKDSHLKQTYSNFQRLGGVSFTTIQLTERPGTDTLDVHMTVNHSKPHSIGYDIEATNSAGDLGAALSGNISQRNIFRGSETLTFKLRGAYEAITGLEGYDGHNYFEIGAELKLSFPQFLLPFIDKRWAVSHGSTTEISLQYNLQNRPEFHRRVLTGAWRYRWTGKDKRIGHRFDLLEVNYVYMPWMSQTFKEQYLDAIGKTNAILKYNYENLLITKLGYTYTYNSLGAAQQTFGKTAHTFKINIETSGNLLRGLTSLVRGKRNAKGQYTFCGIAYAQYAKFDFDYTKSLKLDPNNSLAWRVNFGIAYPFGNSTILPFEKRYFAGGANSVRGWSVRSLGPGSYDGADRGINFINQSGDLQLNLSLEFRAHLFWKLSGALFLDAGNIWTLRNYADQPGGQFRFDTFFKEIALSYGLGFRMNLNFFILRFDAGMKAIDPAHTGRAHYPIYHPNLGRDFAFHFAVGLPF
ncbi:MAG: BamA/TamA family outer membrane protein [Bacteroidaceae bacterium]|nr:BamA/TamA family outer membrane protein [Bacteroidaceae bacterium]